MSFIHFPRTINLRLEKSSLRKTNKGVCWSYITQYEKVLTIKFSKGFDEREKFIVEIMV